MERTYNIPLRKEFSKTPRWKRTNKAVSALRSFISRHMKSDVIKIGKNLNNFLWKHGIKNPPHHVKVNLVKEDDGVVKAELFGHKYEELTKEEMEKKQEKKKPLEKVQEKLMPKTEKKEKPEEKTIKTEPSKQKSVEEKPVKQEKVTKEKPVKPTKAAEKPKVQKKKTTKPTKLSS